MRFSSRAFTQTVGVFLLAIFCALATPCAVQAGYDFDEKGNAFTTGEAIVAFKSGTTLLTAKSILARYGVDPNSIKFIDPQTALVRFDSRKDVLSFCQQMGASSWTCAASPNHLFRCLGIPTDPYYSLQWGLKPGGATVGADFQSASTYSTGSGIKVAVIDTGTDFRHPELAISPNGPIVNPGATLIFRDMTFTNATPWNGSATKNPPFNFVPGSPDDDNGHGTHVTGIIAARTSNKIGVAGAAPGVTIYPLKAADRSGTLTEANEASAIRFAATNGCRVINMSFGGTAGTNAFSITNAVQFAQTQTVAGTTKGVVCVAAMGNNDAANTLNLPAIIPGVVAVGAHGPAGAQSTFSDTGPWITLVAPGGDGGIAAGNATDSGQIFSTYPTYRVALGPPIIPNPTYTNYSYMSGTSMAAPHVTAAAALLLAKKPWLSQAQVWAQLAMFSTHTVPINTVTSRPSGVVTPIPDSAADNNMGYGRLSASALLLANQPTIGKTTGIPHVFPYSPRNHFTYPAGSSIPLTLGSTTLTGLDTTDVVARNASNVFRVIVVDDKGERIPNALVTARFTLLYWVPLPPLGVGPGYPASNISDAVLLDTPATVPPAAGLATAKDNGDLLPEDCVYATKIFIPNDYLNCRFQVQYLVTAPGMRPNTNRVVNIWVH